MAMAAFSEVAGEYPWKESRPGFYGKDIRITKQPVGVVAAIVPWNMPQFLTVGKVVPALLAGCSVVLKPAPESALDALLLRRHRRSRPTCRPAWSTSYPVTAKSGAHLVAHPGVDKVSFTGSTAAGRQVAMACAEGLKQVSLELGGKSAAIVLDDADPAATATAIQMASLANSGQVCNALSRVLVPAARARRIRRRARGRACGSMTVGDPSDPATQLGPLVAATSAGAGARATSRTVQREGARLVFGGSEMPDGLDRGWYVRPTLFADAHNDMRIAREEIFGPVLTVISVPRRGRGRARSPTTPTTVWPVRCSPPTPTAGLAIAAPGARRARSASTRATSWIRVRRYGGVKASGYGRELGREGLDELPGEPVGFGRGEVVACTEVVEQVLVLGLPAE